MLAQPAFAQVTPIIFERVDIRVDPLQPIPQDGVATIMRDSTRYNVELRSEDALQLEYIHTLNDLAEDGGVMILMSQPAMVPLPSMQVFTPVDALFVADDGTILQILPNVTLGELKQDIMAREPIKALLFLKAGEVQKRILQPRDIISGTMFTPAPPVME
jgi:hypothetical protein